MEVFPVSGENEQPFSYHWQQGVDLSDKRILVFGAAGALAESFLYAASCCGARIIAVDLAPEEPQARASWEKRLLAIARNVKDVGPGGFPDVYLADVTSLSDVQAVTDRVFEDGSVDVAIDFAGSHHSPFDFVKDDTAELLSEFRRVLDVNLVGAFIFTAVVAKSMIPFRRGHIIHLCSSGSRLSLYGTYGYNASKHALEGLVKTAAAQLAPLGVRVNGVGPGSVITPLNRRLAFDDSGRAKPRARSILAHTPTKRFATAQGVSETLIALCVEQRHLTGNVVFPDDGYVIDGHSWPEGNIALYEGESALERLFERLEGDYPLAGRSGHDGE